MAASITMLPASQSCVLTADWQSRLSGEDVYVSGSCTVALKCMSRWWSKGGCLSLEVYLF